ncbi:hypothetical protein PPYR_06903 [Photinus pyralis]|uniref:G-protein coupled receptors family 1 profile domain-containing protein n=2 Tax=Photinus pyralis TaxID=7054 RepID=A0A5N4AP09_PHOPY|nr:relaxin receptor 2-like isoform X2 [Photinus pyralis]KAB0799023.1 hypothetical protein PPYR_06903 [Photinus pyralis]
MTVKISKIFPVFLLVAVFKNLPHVHSEWHNSSFTLCEEGYFRCYNSSVCIQQIENCDGKFDCEDGSDEWNCADEEGSKYWDHLFRKNPSAEHEDLDQKCALNYNGSCICRSKVILCQHMNLKRPPNDLPHAEIDLLDFSGNFFGELNTTTVNSIPAETSSLVLRQCAITELHQKTFYKLSYLNSLYLDNNDLVIFPANIFPKKNELTVLVVRRNRLSYVDVNAFQHLTKLIELDLSYNQLTEIQKEMLEPLIKLQILYLSANRIAKIDENTFPPMSLATLSLAENELEALQAGTFRSATTLKNLFLSDNGIHFLSKGTFRNLDNLVSLNLQGNGIKHMDVEVFEDVHNLTSLYLGNNAFRKLPKNLLHPLTKLQYIYFDRFEMCLAATHVRVCEPKGDGISSQEHLLDNPILRTSVWIMGAVGCSGNIIVLLGRLIAPANNVVHSLYIRNLALSDLLMGIYLFVIATADYYYRGMYLQYESDWRHSALCNLCGFLSTLSCESSVLILSLVTWDRFISVTQPLARKQPSAKAAFLTLTFLWIIAITVAAAPLTTIADQYFGDEFYGSNGVCLSLHIHDPYDKGWEYSAAMFVFVNTIALIFICYAYCRMIQEIRASSVACRSTRQSQDRDKVAQRFGVIILTDCLCWVPVICVKLAALSGCAISEALYAWLAILVLPINSALNPVLYTLTTTVFIKQIQKIINSRVFKRKRSDQQNSDTAHSSSFLPRGNGSKRSIFRRGNQGSINTIRTSLKQSTAV